jgi:hypothetical protein
MTFFVSSYFAFLVYLAGVRLHGYYQQVQPRSFSSLNFKVVACKVTK